MANVKESSPYQIKVTLFNIFMKYKRQYKNSYKDNRIQSSNTTSGCNKMKLSDSSFE